LQKAESFPLGRRPNISKLKSALISFPLSGCDLNRASDCLKISASDPKEN